jgi:hypothetical protein
MVSGEERRGGGEARTMGGQVKCSVRRRFSCCFELAISSLSSPPSSNLPYEDSALQCDSWCNCAQKSSRTQRACLRDDADVFAPLAPHCLAWL